MHADCVCLHEESPLKVLRAFFSGFIEKGKFKQVPLMLHFFGSQGDFSSSSDSLSRHRGGKSLSVRTDRRLKQDWRLHRLQQRIPNICSPLRSDKRCDAMWRHDLITWPAWRERTRKCVTDFQGHREWFIDDSHVDLRIDHNFMRTLKIAEAKSSSFAIKKSVCGRRQKTKCEMNARNNEGAQKKCDEEAFINHKSRDGTFSAVFSLTSKSFKYTHQLYANLCLALYFPSECKIFILLLQQSAILRRQFCHRAEKWKFVLSKTWFMSFVIYESHEEL